MDDAFSSASGRPSRRPSRGPWFVSATTRRVSRRARSTASRLAPRTRARPLRACPPRPPARLTTGGSDIRPRSNVLAPIFVFRAVDPRPSMANRQLRWMPVPFRYDVWHLRI